MAHIVILIVSYTHLMVALEDHTFSSLASYNKHFNI